MLRWKNPGRGSRRMMEVMNLIFLHHPKLLEFLFIPEGPYLRQEAEWLVLESAAFSSGEKVLVRIALNLWNGHGNVSLWDLIETLDLRSYHQVIRGLRHLRRFEPDAPEMVFRQLKLDIF